MRMILESLELALTRAARTKPIASAANGSLKRCLGLRDVVGFGLGLTIGGGIFVATGEAALIAGPAVVLSFMFASMGCAFSGICYAEMARIVPSAGSSYSYSYTALGELAACVAGIVAIVGNILSGAAVARGWAAYFSSLLSEGGLSLPGGLHDFEYLGFTVSPSAFVLVVFVVFLNSRGTDVTASLNGIVTALSIALLLSFNVAGVLSLDISRWAPFMPKGAAGVFRGAGTVFFSYLGFDCLACLAEEVDHPRTVSRGIIITLVLATILYCSTSIIFTGLVTADEIDLGSPLSSACKSRGMHTVAVFIAVAAVGNTMTTVIGSVVGSPRICYAMAQDGLLPPDFAMVNERGVPAQALMWTAVPTAIFAVLVEFEALADVVSAGALCNFSFVCIALVLSQRRGSSPQPEQRSQEMGASPSSAVKAQTLGSSGRRPDDEEDIVMSPTVGLRSSMYTSNADGTSFEKMMGAYSVLSFAVGLTLKFVLLHTGIVEIVLLSTLVILLAIVFVVILRASRSLRSSDVEGLQWPLLPLVPLVGILMNMLMLSGLPFQALLSALGVDAVCCVFYFAYVASRSKLSSH